MEQKVKHYQKEPANARALCQAVSWLEAVGIPCRLDGADLILSRCNGGEVKVRLAMAPGEPVDAQERITVLARDLASPKSDIALKAFHTITEAAGYGSPTPVDRGPEPIIRPRYLNDFELVGFRHREFRRAPNPDPKELLKYEKIMRQSCYRFINTNQDLCRRNCLMVEDLMTYARVYTTTYLGLYKVQVETTNDNVKKLKFHLNQRFGELVGTIKKKERNCLPSPDAAQIAVMGKTIDENHSLEGFSDDPMYPSTVAVSSSEDKGYLARHNELNIVRSKEITETDWQAMSEQDKNDYWDGQRRADDQRRRNAANLLAKNLQQLPHDKMVQLLQDASLNQIIAPDARLEASRRLRLHRKNCEKCIAAIAVVPVKPEEVQPATETLQVPVKPEEPKVAPVLVPNILLETRIADAKKAFEAVAPATMVCATCHQLYTTQIRLMNRPALKAAVETGKVVNPKFSVQSNCGPCRRPRKD